MRTIALALALLATLTGRAGIIIDTPCTDKDIRLAITTFAQEGDTVAIRAGDCIITNVINLSRAISFNIVGAGTNLTTLRSTNITTVFSFTKTSTNVVTISDMDCVGHPHNDIGFFNTGGGAPGVPYLGTVRFTRIQMTNIHNVGITSGGSDSKTLIDHSLFRCWGNPLGVTPFNAVKFFGNGNLSWATNGNQLGSTNVGTYVEYCRFENPDGTIGNGFIDCYNGGSGCFRFNYCDGDTAFGSHGYDSQPTSFKSMECYGNIFTNNKSHLFVSRGGLLLFYSNSIYQTNLTLGASNWVNPLITYYRATYGALQNGHIDPVFATYPGYILTNTFTNVPSSVTFGFTYTFGSSNQVTSTPNLNGLVATGATWGDTLEHLCEVMNSTWTNGAKWPHAGSWYTKVNTNAYPSGRSPSLDYIVTTDNTNTLFFKNRLDGLSNFAGSLTGDGLRAAYGPGQMTQPLYTNVGGINHGNYQWANTVYFKDGTHTNTSWELNGAVNGPLASWSTSDTYGHPVGLMLPNNSSNLLRLNFEFFNAVDTNYTPLIAPHPLDNDNPPPPPSGSGLRWFRAGIKRAIP